MPLDSLDELKRRLARHGQEHVLHWWDDLTEPQRARLREQIVGIDFDRIEGLVRSGRQSTAATESDSTAARARQAASPASMVRLPKTSDDQDRWKQARRAGEELLAAGKVAAILVAGGQGTRLGFDRPKGTLSIGPISGASLFQILAEQVLARSRRARQAIPYLIMTSDATHDDTIGYFAEHRHFGLPSSDVYFFRQGNMPAVDSASGKLLLSDNAIISTSPDGHGGMLAALASAGLLEEMSRRGVEHLHYHQVDNPTAIVCDPVFLGYHLQRGSEMSTKVVAKRSAQERMGVVVAIDGQTQIIEYSDLPADVAAKTDPAGNLLLWAGNTAIHVFSRSFLERAVAGEVALPFHVAHKKVPFLDEHGKRTEPARENAYKFERFIFDALPAARQALVLETDRQREFNPIKNATGDDSPKTAQAALRNLHRLWLEQAGVSVDDSTPIEISPLFALEADDVQLKCKPNTRLSGPTLLI